jgi:uncharacterized protein (DUF488 family)
MTQAAPFFTIGHSNRSLAEFEALLREAGVELVADIRKMPMSRANPQFNHDALAPALAAQGMAYEHIAALGGLRGRSPGLARALNGYWRCRPHSAPASNTCATRGSRGAAR